MTAIGSRTVLLLVMLASCASSWLVTPEPVNAQLSFQPYVSGFTFPGVMAFAPDGRLFVTELRSGNIFIVENGIKLPDPAYVMDVEQTAEAGLLGIVFDPNFETTDPYVYLWYVPNGSILARIGRLTITGNTGSNLVDLVTGIPTNTFHNGGNLAIGPDEKLYLTMGDNGDSNNAQDVDVLPGKVHRFNLDGSIPTDNPYSPTNSAWCMGLRNSFDFTFNAASGKLYADGERTHL